MVKRIKFTPEAFEKYLDGLNEKFETTIVWNTLDNKSEYGFAKSEKFYAVIAAHNAASMARKLGSNEERVSFFTKCLCSAFPAYGKEGQKRMEEYAIAYDLPYDEIEIKASVIEESFSQSGKFVIEGLRDILLKLFDESLDSGVPEIELAKLYHAKMEASKAAEHVSESECEERKNGLDREIEDGIHSVGIVACKERFLMMETQYPESKVTMTQEESERYYRLIDLYRAYAGDECLIQFMLHAKNPA